MVEKAYIQKALLGAWSMEESPRWKSNNPALGQSSLISQLICDIFGGEILKTPSKKSWHFYNRIDGEIFDFAKSKTDSLDSKRFEGLLTSPDETYAYFAQEDYLIFSRRFYRAFENALHIEKKKYD